MVGRQSFLLPLLVLMVVALVAGLTWVNYRFSMQNPGGNDFLARWMGAHYWVMEGVSPYDDRVSLASQEMIYGHPADPSKGEDTSHFVYPLPSMLFFAPFGILDYPAARTLWMTLLEVSAIILALVSLHLVSWNLKSPLAIAGVILFSVLWYPGVRTIIVGQFAGLNALLIVTALLMIPRKQDTAAGILLVLTLVKPQMAFLIVPFVLLWSLSVRRNQVFFGMLAGGAALLAVSLLLMPDWPLQWIGQMLDYPSYTDRIGSVVSIVAAAMPGIRTPVSIFLYALFLGYLFFEWKLALGKNEQTFIWTALMTLVITTFVAFRTATTHFGTLLPVIFLIFMVWSDRWGKWGKWMVASTSLILLVGQWALFLTTVQGNEEQAIMYLPVPLFCLVGLWWVRWWAIHPPKLAISGFDK